MSTHILLITWILLIVISVLLLYRSLEFDRIYTIYSILLALIILMIYCAQSGSDPKALGTALYIIFFIGLVFIYTQSALYVNKSWAWRVYPIFLLLIVLLTIYILIHPHYFNVSSDVYEPPHWYSESMKDYLIYFFALLLIVPLVEISIDNGWKSNVGITSIITILYIIGAGIISSVYYKDSRVISVWFYLLSAIPLIFWVSGMLRLSNN